MNAANAAAGKPANARLRVLFYVQHLLGIGHLKRATTLTRALEGAGFAVTMVSGGFEVPGIDAGGKETEQTLRARLLQERSALQVVWEDDIGPETIARAADAALLGPPLSAAGIDTNGAAEIPRILGALIAHDAPITA